MAAPVPADVLRAIAHPLRLALLVALEEREQAPADLATALGATEPAIAEQLAVLHDAGLVTAGSAPGLHRTVPGWAEIAKRLGALQDR
jgi:DNA-binding transcriptional ArsR family regulator